MAAVTDKNKIQEVLTRRIGDFEGRPNIWPSKEEAEKKLKENKGLRIYFGIDPTGSELHLGHVVSLLFLKQLLELGQIPVLVIGDFTARIGDPSGKDTTRKPLTQKEIQENMGNYLEQVYKILPKGSFEIKHNSEWLDKMPLGEFFRIVSNVSVYNLENRSMFRERKQKGNNLAVHEFLYPILQGYDSVAMNIDGEIGGIDQMFNMLMGRDLMKKLLGKEKLVFGVKLLEDPITGKKMSKSEGEIIAITDEPNEIRRKVLAIDDKMTKTIFELCTEKEQDWIDQKHKELSPREFKEELARELIRIYHGEKAVENADQPTEYRLEDKNTLQYVISGGLNTSMSAAKNLIEQGAVEVNGKVTKEWIEVKIGDEIKVGKGKFLKIK